MLGKDYEWFRELREHVTDITLNFLIMAYVLNYNQNSIIINFLINRPNFKT